MDLVFESLGNAGDVAPLIAVSREMQNRGHSCELLTSEQHTAEARAAGVRATPVSSQRRAGHRPGFDDYLYRSHAAIAEYLSHRGGSAPVLVNCDRHAATNLVAERTGWPVVRVHLSPSQFDSYDEEAPRRELFARNRHILSHVNTLRKRLGLTAVDSALHDEAYVIRHVALFPEWFAAPVPASVPAMNFVGFPPLLELGSAPPLLQSFVEREGSPLAFVLGLNGDDLDAFIVDAERCCSLLGLPGVMLCPRGLRSLRGSRRLMLCPFGALGSVLRVARSLIHHGDVGTVASALEAGLPQIVVPLRFDHVDNGARLERLGVAKVVEPTLYTARGLASAARHLLHTDEAGERAELLGRRVRRANPIQSFADLLEANLDAVA